MKTAPLLRIDGPREDDLRLLPVKLRLKVLRWLLCIIVSTGVPDLAWAQYSSGGYSRPGGGSTSGYSASSRRAPVSSSGGYSRRSYAGGGYATGSLGDRAVSRSLSSQAFRDYQAAQQPAETYVRRSPAYAGGSDWPSEAPRRPSVWGGQQPATRVARGPALPGSGPLTAVALWAALNSLSSPGSAAYFHNYQYDPGYVQWRREADREAGHNPAVAAKLDATRHPARANGRSAAQPVRGTPRPTIARTKGRVGLYLARPFHWHRHPVAALVVAAPHGSTGCRRGRPRPDRQRSDTVPCRHDHARRSVPVSAGCRIDQGAAAGGQRHDQRRGGGPAARRQRPAASALPAGRQSILSAPSRRRWPTGRMPLLFTAGRGHPGGQPGVGAVARSRRRHDRMAVLSDQGRQDVRTRLGAGQQPRSAAKDGGNAAIRRPCRTAPIADDALRRSHRRHAARASRPSTSSSAPSRRRARHGSRSTPASTSTRRG